MKNNQEKIVRELIREVLIQEGFFGDVWQGIKSGVGKAYDIVAPSLGIEKPQSSVLQALNSLSPDEDKGSTSGDQVETIGTAPPDNKDAVIMSEPPHPEAEDWSDRLGTETARGINFHMVKDSHAGTSSANFRSGMKEKHVTPSVEFFKNLNSVFGIKKVITLNSDDRIPALAQAAGLETYHLPLSDSRRPDYSEFEKIKSWLESGNTLVHCTHGADRTGAIIGRYYIDNGIMSVPDAIAETKKYGGDKYPGMMRFLRNGPEN